MRHDMIYSKRQRRAVGLCQASGRRNGETMILYDEIYFEISARGQKHDVKKLAEFLRSGELDDFLDISGDYVHLDDNYSAVGDGEATALVFTNDDLGIEVDEFDVDEFLDVFCKAAKALDVAGSIYDADESEFCFESPVGSADFYDTRRTVEFNDELDEAAREEEGDDEGEE